MFSDQGELGCSNFGCTIRMLCELERFHFFISAIELSLCNNSTPLKIPAPYNGMIIAQIMGIKFQDIKLK